MRVGEAYTGVQRIHIDGVVVPGLERPCRSQRVGEVRGEHKLDIRKPGLGSVHVLDWPVGPVVERIVEDAVGGPNRPTMAPGGVPSQAKTGCEAMIISRNQTSRDTRIIRIEKTGRRVRHDF